MKKLAVFLLTLSLLAPALFSPHTVHAAGNTYYVSNSGSDSNNGTDPTTPWQTINKVNTSTFNPGDSILFKRGDTWREQLTVPSSGTSGNPITFGAYGTGNKPVISGADILSSGWVADTGTKLGTDGNTVALWNFDNDLTDASGNGYSLTTVASTPTYISDPYGTQAIEGNGAWYASITDTGDHFDFGSGSFTIEMEFRWNASSGVESGIVSKGISASGAIWRFERYANGIRIFTKDGTGTAYDIIDSTNYADNTWRHAAAVFDRTGNTLKLYVNGVQVGSTVNISAATNWDSSQPLVVGSLLSNGNSYQIAGSDIAEIRISNTARNSANFPTAISAALPNVWNKPVTTEPKVVIFNTSIGTHAVAKTSIDAANKWYWGNNMLSVFSTADPSTAFTTPGLQAGKRDHAFQASAKDYISVDSLEFQAGNHPSNGTVQFDITSGGVEHNQIIRNSTIKNGAGDGVLISAFPNVATLTGSSVINNVITNTGRFGISLFQTNASSGNENIISNNDISGFYLTGIETRGDWIIINNNTVHDGGNITQVGGGVHLYSGSINEGTGDHNIVRQNLIHDISGHLYDGYGISTDQWSDNALISYNTIYNTDGPGIYLFDSANSSVLNNSIYNSNKNSSGDGQQLGGIRLTSSGSPNNLTTNATIKNNIAYLSSSGSYPIYIDSNTSANILTISNNIFYRPSGNWYFWNTTGGNNLQTWNTLKTGGADINADPKLTNPSSGDLTLQSTSPALDAGQNLGSPYNLGLNPTSVWPGSVTTLDQSTNGSGYEIGAYVYPNLITPVAATVSAVPPAPMSGSTHHDISTLLPSPQASVTTTSLPVVTSSISFPSASFSTNHRIGDTASDIQTLQQWLNAHGFVLASSGPGSPGQETTKFGALTYKALIRYQASVGLSATGWFGPMTRGAIASE